MTGTRILATGAEPGWSDDRTDGLRVLIYSINYSPELTGIGKYTGEMAQWLATRGHEVRVITAPPFSPEWRIGEGYSGWRYRREPGVSGRRKCIITRCPVWVPRRPSGTKRLLHLLSFALSSLPVVLAHVLWRPEVVWVVEPTCFLFPFALLAGRMAGAKCWLHVQDFEVDVAFQFGLLPDWQQKWVAAGEEFFLSRFDRVSTISRAMLARLLQKSVATHRTLLFPNWVDTRAIYPTAAPSPFRAELGLPAQATVVLYSGNMAKKQGLEVLIEAARNLANHPGLHIVLSGDGPARSNLVEALSSLPKVHVLPLQPLARLNDLLNIADIHLLPQRADAADLVLPSKLTGMLASGRPVVATALPGTELARIVEQCGIVVPPGDAAAICRAVLTLADQRELRLNLGARARDYAVCNLDADRVLGCFEREMIQLCRPGISAETEPITAATKQHPRGGQKSLGRKYGR